MNQRNSRRIHILLWVGLPVIAALIGTQAGLMTIATPAEAKDPKTKHTNIAGFPLPLYWGMPKTEIESIISANGLHLAKSSRKHLQKRRYGPGKHYSWAAIKEEHLEFLEQRRFIVIYLDEHDRLSGLSLKLLSSELAVHKAELINIATKFKKEYGDPINEEQLIKLGGGLGNILRYAYKVGNQMIFETEFMEMKGGRGLDITNYVNLYWDGS